MKKRNLIIAVAICCLLLLYILVPKYQRISFESKTLGEELAEHISADTKVTNMADEDFPTQLPIYRITERKITEDEFQQMLQNLGIDNKVSSMYHLELEGNQIHGLLAGYADPARGDFADLNMTDEQLETLAWETFRKIPFMEGNYEYLGITASTTVWSLNEGERATRVGVSFQRLLDDVRVVGNDRCDLYFDGSGLVEMHIALFSYEKIGTMDMVTLEDAAGRIKTPDDFNIDADSGVAQTLQVDRVKLLLVNQYSEGCTILQPIYNFIGVATLEDGTQAEFSSKVIAIPESYTYEKIQFE